MAQVLSPIPSVVTVPTPGMRPENRSLSLDIATAFSPVDERGAFMHDKIFKEGWLHQRTRKTKNWKRRWYVLRGSAIGVYKDDQEKKLHRQIQLSDLTAVAPLKGDKRPHIFGIFSPSRNYHLQATSDKELEAWVSLVREVAALEDTDEPVVMSPTTAEAQPIPVPRRTSVTFGPSSPTSRPQDGHVVSPVTTNDHQTAPAPETGVQRKESELSNLEGQLNDSRVVWHGYLYVLKSKSGIRQWKKIWVVLRPKNITFYKNDDEYRAIKLISLENVLDVVEINPISKSKQHCMQMILENKTYRFAAKSEETLTKWLGAIKSTLAKSRR
ncbi:Myosin-X [Dactylellina cionopaga]|nr:Myosin-X [Dactylellina cionopaga]